LGRATGFGEKVIGLRRAGFLLSTRMGRDHQQQRAIEKVTDFLVRPSFLFVILVIVTLWIIVNILLAKFGLPNFDPPPFIRLQGVLSLGALLQATVILITQNRRDESTERRRQLDVQVSLLLDQKMSKLITMVDELRRAHPALQGGNDPQVEALKKTVDPHQSLETLKQLLDEEEWVLIVQDVQNLMAEVTCLQLVPVLAKRLVAFFTPLPLFEQQLLKAITLL